MTSEGTDMPVIAVGRGALADEQWRVVDEGWGRRAVDFATLSEAANCREYVAVHHRLGVDAGDRVLDVACGAGLAVELAGIRGCWRSRLTDALTLTFESATCASCRGRMRTSRW
jgi:cyclopropane fatty-acyl-phospholipid synthase-like methyltransferase